MITWSTEVGNFFFIWEKLLILRERSIRIIGAVVMVVQLNSNNLKNILRVLVRSMFHQEEEQLCCSTTTRYLYRTANHSQTERDI